MFARNRTAIRDDRDKRIIKKNLDRYPRGYPWLAAFTDSDEDSVLFRRFGTLHARCLLYLEVELTDLEAELDELDREDGGPKDAKGNDAPDRWKIAHSIHLKNGAKNERRKELIEKINQKLEAYDSLLLKDTELRKLRRPSLRVHRNFLDTIYTEQPVGVKDQRFIYHRDDFVSLQQYEESWLDELMHRVVAFFSKTPLKYLVVSSDDESKTDDPYIHYYSASRLGVIIKIIIAFFSTALLLVPIYLFTTLDWSAKMMAFVTLIFAFVFCAAVSTFTEAKRHEVFAATAAYCAVLVVFIGNLQQRQMDK